MSIVGKGIHSIQNAVNNAAPEAVATNSGVDSGARTDTPLPADGGQQQLPGSSFRWSELLENAWMLWLGVEITSNISGTVDLVLFSPHIQGKLNQEQRITFGGSDETKTVNLSEGRWSYNCTGFFDSGDISIIGTIK